MLQGQPEKYTDLPSFGSICLHALGGSGRLRLELHNQPNKETKKRVAKPNVEAGSWQLPVISSCVP